MNELPPLEEPTCISGIHTNEATNRAIVPPVGPMRQSVAITYLYLIDVGVILAHWKLQHLPHCPHFCSITCGFAVWHLPYTRVSRSCYAAVAASTAGVNVVLCVFLTPRVFDVVISRPWPIDVGQAPSPDLYADKFSYCLCHCHWHLCLQHYSIDPVLTHVLAFEFFSFISAMLMQFRFVRCKTARNRRKMRNSGAPVIVRFESGSQCGSLFLSGSESGDGSRHGLGSRTPSRMHGASPLSLQ